MSGKLHGSFAADRDSNTHPAMFGIKSSDSLPVEAAMEDDGRQKVSVAGTGASSTEMQGTAADGATAVGKPVQTGGKDGAGNAQTFLTDTDGHQQIDVLSIAAGDNNIGNMDVASMPTGAAAAQVQGTVADGSAAAQNPVQTGGKDGSGNIQTFLTHTDGSTVVVDQAFSSRTVSAADTPQSVTLDLHGAHSVLDIHSAASAGTATLTVEVSVNNVDFLTIDSIGAAATQIKHYINSTVGAGIALTPLAFRYIKITAGTAGASNTTTLTIAVK